jgi:hypothetical protein
MAGSPGRGERRSGLTGDEILPAHDYHNTGKCLRGLLLGLVLFKLVAPPLQPRVVESYSIHGVWFPSHLLLEGSGRI